MSTAKEEFFTRYIGTVQTRMQTLYRDAQQCPSNQSQHLVTTLNELSLAVEELHVAKEELIAQNDQLVATQCIVETERQRYQDLFNFAPDGYLVTDLKGVIKEANHAAAILLKMDQSCLIGQPLVIYFPQTEQRSFYALLDQIVAMQRVKGWEFTLQRRRAETIIVATTVKTVQDVRGHAVGLWWQMRDISDRKKAEATLNQLQAQNLELLEADRLRSQLLATVSHEFKTPLNAILGFSQLLMRQLSPQNDPKTYKMVERIFHNGQHLLTMVEDMLSVSRLRADKVELKLETFDMAALIADTLDELESLAHRKALPLKAELPDRPVMVVNDRSRLRQILTNLISNAVKFTDIGRVVVCLEALPANRLLLQAKDTGCGISPENQAHIFQEFWQVHDARSTVKGTGLGLAIVQALVEVMQGTITINSELGRGSQFCIELPQTVTPAQAHLGPCR